MDAALGRALEARLGVALEAQQTCAGGSINRAWGVDLADGRRVFVKANASAAAGMFEAEARGLEWLRAGLGSETGLEIPAVLAVDASFLVLEWVEPGGASRSSDESLGRGLAALHRSVRADGADRGFGLDHDNFIGSEPQSNGPSSDWPSFYRRQRLEPMLARAERAKTIDAAWRRRFEPLFARLDQLCGPPERPARLHGDLWSGNAMVSSTGAPVLIDPAVYRGHREVDLAMMRLFGGFSPACFAAYAEVWPLAEGWERRVDLYQLYPLLVHVVLFGGSYLASVEAALRRLL